MLGNSAKQSPKIVLPSLEEPFIIQHMKLNSTSLNPDPSLQRVCVSVEDMSMAGQTRLTVTIHRIKELDLTMGL